MKLCKKCNEEKPLNQMVKSSNTKDGYLYKCKECQLAYRKTIRHEVIEGEYECRKCESFKHSSLFPKNPRKANGLGVWCKDCVNQQRREQQYWKTSGDTRKQRAKDDPEYRDYLREQKRLNARKNIESTILSSARTRAKKKGYEFDLDISDIIIPKICPILEVPIVIGDKNGYEYTPSIDRIDNSKGYVKGNIQIISKKANSMKNSASPEELLKFAEWVTKELRNHC
jgi:hypothetical protein